MDIERESDDTEKILELFNKDKNINYSKFKNVILVLGVADSGKNTFTQFVGKTNYYFEPETTESEVTTETHAVLPGMLEDAENKVVFYDFPGFSLQPNPVRDIALSYYIKSVLDSADSVKLIFTIPHDLYLRVGDLKFLLPLASAFINDLEKYKKSVALVVTNVENFVAVPDQVIINGIVEALQRSRSLIRDTRILEFIDNLLEKDEHGSKERIGIFRKLNKVNEFTRITLLQQNKEYLKKLIHENVKFITYYQSDFKYTSLYSNTRQARQLFDKVDEKLLSELRGIRPEIEKYYYKQEEQSRDIHDFYNKIQSWTDAFSSQQGAVGQCADFRCVVNRLTTMIIHHDICPTNERFSKIKSYYKYLEFLSILIDVQFVSRLPVWIQEFSTGIQTYLDDTKKWYNFFIYLHDVLSNNDVQRNLYKISNVNPVECQNKENVIIIDCNFESVIESISATLLNDIKKNDSFSNIMDAKLDEVKLKFLNTILDKTVKHKVSYSCEKDNKLLIKGYNVQLSSIHDAKCPGSKVIEIFALNKILIDCYSNHTGDELLLSIIAPEWEITDKWAIHMDGEDGEKYPAVQNNGLGRDGRAGKPGGPAGSFLGIGQSFINAEYLSITANGGNGATGEDGDDGTPGIDATVVHLERQIPKDGRKASWHDKFCHYHDKCNNIITKSSNGIPYTYIGKHKCDGSCTLSSPEKNCTDGGKGGDGGVGGKGGKPGKIILFWPKEESNIKINNIEGSDGRDGKGGKGAQGGIRELYVNVTLKTEWKILRHEVETYYYTKSEPGFSRCRHGKNGRAGQSEVNFQRDAKSAVTIYSPIIINDYKNYLRENLRNGVMESSLRNFLEDLDKIDEYDTLGYMDELYGIEQQFYKLRKEFPMLPFYESLQKRVRRYTEKLHTNGALTEDQRKVLRYLCTAISTKICSINGIAANDFTINIGAHLNQALDDINELKTLDDITRKDSYLSEYQKDIDGKIEEAKNYIDTIKDEIDAILIQIDGNIKKLIQAVYAKRDESIEEASTLMEQKKQLKNTLSLRIVLGVPKIFSWFLFVLGPAGAAASIAISSGLTVTEALLLDNTANPTVSKLSTLPAAVTYSLTKMSEILKFKQLRIQTQVEEGLSVLKNIEPNNDLSDIKTRLKDLNNKVSNLADDDYELAEKLHKEQREIKTMIDSRTEKIEQDGKKIQMKLDEESTHTLRTLLKLQVIFATIDVSINLYNDVKNNQAMIDDVDELLKGSQDKIKSLLEYEDKIYHIIVPICRDLKNSVRKTQNSLKGKSNVALDVSSWQIKNILKDAKFQLERLTADFDEQKDLIDSVRKLQDAMDITIKMYDYIQKYQERKGSSNLMANMNLNQAKEVLSDTKLNNAVDNLKLIVKSNLILEKYENARDAFKQYVFPYADFYFAKHDLPAFLQPNDTLSIATDVTKIIEDLKLEIVKYNGGESNYREDLPKRHAGVKFGCPSDLIESFFVWKYNSYKQEIHRLLDGAEVVLKSDIRHGFNKNAIKFSDIGIQFRFANRTIQNDFDYEIQDYEVSMVHLGLSYYRCDNKIYTITSNNTQYISYIAKKNCAEKAQITNELHDQIRISRAVLSPYGFWKLKLTHNNGKNETLGYYKDKEIDLVLEGTGDYIDLGLAVCKGNLSKYYTLDNSASEVKYFGFIEHKLLHHSLIVSSERYDRVGRSIQIDDYMQDIEENLVLTNSGCSSVKLSYLGELLSTISNSMIIFKNWMPKMDLLHWFDNGKEKVNQEMSPNSHINSCTEVPFLNVEQELPKISNQFADGESATINSFSNSSFCTNDNLLLLDLMIRRKSGIKYKQNNVPVSRQFDAQYAQNLAYGSHFVVD